LFDGGGAANHHLEHFYSEIKSEPTLLGSRRQRIYRLQARGEISNFGAINQIYGEELAEILGFILSDFDKEVLSVGMVPIVFGEQGRLIRTYNLGPNLVKLAMEIINGRNEHPITPLLDFTDAFRYIHAQGDGRGGASSSFFTTEAPRQSVTSSIQQGESVNDQLLNLLSQPFPSPPSPVANIWIDDICIDDTCINDI
jgi:hypothetical protein